MQASGAFHGDDLAALREVGRRRSYRAGATLYHEADDSTWVVLLVTGRVKVTSSSEDGHEAVLAIRGPGDLLGELSAIDGRPRSATVTALDDVDAVVVTPDTFRAFLQARPAVALRLLELLAARLRDADRKRLEFGAYDTETRVARRVLELAERFGEQDGDAVHIALSLSQEDLASWVGSSREAVSRALRSLRDRGCIETQRRRITVLDLAALQRRAQ